MSSETSIEAVDGAGSASNADDAGVSATSAGPSDWLLLHQAAPLSEYCESWLRIQCDWIGDVERAVVCRVAGSGGQREILATRGEGASRALSSLIDATLAEGMGLAGPAETDVPASGSTDHFGVSHTAAVGGAARLVVAVEVVRARESDLAPVLRQLQWGGGWLERRLGGGWEATAPDLAGPSLEAHRLLDFFAIVLEAGGYAEACQSLVTELARALGCERVSLGVEHRGRFALEAVSHSAAFGREMNLVRGIEAAMLEARDQNSSLARPEHGESGPPLIVREHEALLRDHNVGSVLTIPVARPGALPCAVTFEHADADAFDPATVAALETGLLGLGPVLELWRLEDRMFLVKMRDAFARQLARLFGPRYLGRKLVTVVVALFVAFFALATGEYRIGAEGTLEGERRRVHIAPFDGYVAEAFRRAGDFVDKGEVLATLDDRELELERLKWASRLVQLERQSDEARSAREYGRTSILVAQIDEARAEIARLEERLVRTEIRAAFDGLVVSGDLSQSLGAAVSRGDALFEIAPLDLYRILLNVDEEQIADVAVGQSGTLLLSALPEEPIDFEVTKVTPVAAAEEGRNFFRVEGTLRDVSERLRPGMEGVGKIAIDERRLVWIWTRSFQNWLRLWFWSWWP